VIRLIPFVNFDPALLQTQWLLVQVGMGAATFFLATLALYGDARRAAFAVIGIMAVGLEISQALSNYFSNPVPPYRVDVHDVLARAAGALAAWWYEPLNWRMADNTYYRPDFLVMRDDGALELHEVKGRKNGKDGKPDTFWKEEDAWLKLKIVAEQAPFPLCVVWPRRDGGWQIETV
jgi:hypothetical protein